ncbi:hypothetical protein CBOM_08076 [Ceraceosorus bombacis]|uniref:Uncharacterized protein n=1 Tax=Ceraceosorus bombacis TaxID=401625 RepID=A0A0P1BRH7_9BASI|nr:hypothetical protein CBOM_08076 [Ceraceosorus bombacis]
MPRGGVKNFSCDACMQQTSPSLAEHSSALLEAAPRPRDRDREGMRNTAILCIRYGTVGNASRAQENILFFSLALSVPSLPTASSCDLSHRTMPRLLMPTLRDTDHKGHSKRVMSAGADYDGRASRQARHNGNGRMLSLEIRTYFVRGLLLIREAASLVEVASFTIVVGV